jgi:hypothetical protein
MPEWLGSAIQGAIGVGQIVGGLIGKGKANRELTNLEKNSPRYAGTQSIMDYYDIAKQRYGVDPTQSAQYRQGQNLLGRNMASILNANNMSRGGSSNINKYLQQANDASLSLLNQAELQRNQRFSQLGQATQMDREDKRFMFDVNVASPFLRKYGLAAEKLKGSMNIAGAGLRNASDSASVISLGTILGKKAPR